jgi:CRP-like cAMP-binding protein
MPTRQAASLDTSIPKQVAPSRRLPIDDGEFPKVLDDICAKGDWLHLRAQQRIPLPPPGKVIVLRSGMLAIDVMPAKEKLQVLEFLITGDVVSASTLLLVPGISLRAITNVTLVSIDPPERDGAIPTHDYWTFLSSQCMRQLARANIHQMMIGRLETDARVASFILGLALRGFRKDAPEICVSLPMSRTDIANYLVINCDTLSRTMMKFCDSGLLERKSRHIVRVVDLDALKKRSPLASLLSAVFEKVGLMPKPAEMQVSRSLPVNVPLDIYEAVTRTVVTGAAHAQAGRAFIAGRGH